MRLKNLVSKAGFSVINHAHYNVILAIDANPVPLFFRGHCKS